MSQQYNKRRYSLKEFYIFLKEASRTMRYMIKGKKVGHIDERFISRIMLAVTEVNGCEICSYFHTAQALKNGMTEKDISTMLSGSMDDLPEDEGVALFFAQHYADAKGKPSKASWKRLIEVYGREKALAILGATRAIMVGNTHGIAIGALKNRMTGKPLEMSSLRYEISIAIGIVFMLPVAVLHGAIDSISKKPLFMK